VSRPSRYVSAFLLPLVVFGVAILAWQTIVTLGRFPPFILPGPLVVLEVMWDKAIELVGYTARTGFVAICGFIISLLLGVVISLCFSQSTWLRQGGYPFAIFFQTVPVVAVAPLIIAICGYGIGSVIAVAAMISLFPIITSTTTGLITVDPGLHDLFRLNRASRWQILWKLQFPGAVRYLLTGMKTSAGLAVVGAIVGEFFAGYSGGAGLGYFILISKNQTSTANLFAGTICSTLLGVVIFGAVSAFGATCLRRWVWDGNEK